MNDIPQTRFTMHDMGEHESDRRERAIEAWKAAGLSVKHAAVVAGAQQKVSAALGLSALLRRDGLLEETAGEGETLGMGGYFRGCVEDALDLLLQGIYRDLSDVGGET